MSSVYTYPRKGPADVGRARWPVPLVVAGSLAAVLLVLALILPAPAHAQLPPGADEPAPLPLLSSQPLGGKGNTWSVAAGDVNGDGFIDVVVGGGFYQSTGLNRIYLNDGAGRFGRADLVRDFDVASPAKSIALADLNGDGALDIVAGNYEAANQVFLNDGAGTFVDGYTFGPEAGQTQRIAVGDLTGDGYLDVVTGDSCQGATGNCDPVRFFVNDGQGRLGEGLVLDATAAGLSAGALALTYADGDDSLDLVVGFQGAANRVYLNDGQGGFGAPGRVQEFGTADGWTLALAAGDLDGDGHLDLVEAVNFKWTSPIYRNDGSGSFQPWGALEAGEFNDVVALALADLNGDGALDVVGGAGDTESPQQNLVFLNDGAGGFGSPLAFGSPSSTSGVAVADFNNDGVLDVVVGSFQNAEVWVYLRAGQGLFAPAREFGATTTTRGAALGDMDGNGWLDVVLLGGYNADNTIYFNDGACLLDATCETYTFGNGASSSSLALADLNGDGYLDVVEGNEGQNHLYLNSGAQPFAGLAAAIPLGSPNEDTHVVTVADLNGDGHLDVLVGNDGQNYLYLNDPQGRARFDRPGAIRAFGTGDDATYALAVGDLDQDGHPDVVVGNGHGLRGGKYVASEQNRIYRNNGAGFFSVASPFGKSDDTAELVLADLDGNGALDIVAVNAFADRNQVYYNDGAGSLSAGTAIGAFKTAVGAAAADLDGDGDLDLVVGNYSDAEFYVNRGNGLAEDPLRIGNVRDYGSSGMALGDLDGDGLPDLIVSRGSSYNLASRLYLNRARTTGRLPNNPPYVTVGYPAATFPAGLHFSPQILKGRYLTIPFTLSDAEGDAVGRVAVSYSLDGGGRWRLAVPREDSVLGPLAASPQGTAHAFVWDTLATGVFGLSDNVVVRVLAYPQARRGALVGSYLYPNRVPDLGQWPFAASVTAVFRVRGTQVRVLDEAGQPLAGAYVYRLPQGQYVGAQPMPDAAHPLQTDLQGFLPGRGELAAGDRVMAVLPFTPTQPLTFTNQYHYFLTSAAPEEDGLAMKVVSETGVVDLIIPTDASQKVNPLLLFDLTVSLEWDATGDNLFMLELEEGFKRASELLFDVSNGQVALGRVHILPAKTFWNRADVLLYANNGLRPSAAIGGVVNGAVGDRVRPAYEQPPTEAVAKAYVPGQIRIGTTWDPFGEDAGDLGEAWWRALAHELAHHLLFLPDNYVGLKPDNPDDPGGKRYLGRIDCQGSFMTTTRDPSYTEFLTEAEWIKECQESLAENTTGRTDWQTVVRFYPMLYAPAQPFEGPTALPLEVTHVLPWRLPTGRTTLPARYLDLRDDEKERLRLPGAQVYLFQTQGTADPSDDLLLALGAPTSGGDRVKVRGAQPGDRLCLYDFSWNDRAYVGCVSPVSGSTASIYPIKTLAVEPGGARWAPSIQVSALTTRTLSITVTQALEDGAALKAQVFPAHYPSAPGIAPTADLAVIGDGVFAQTVRLLYPASDVSVRIWVDDASGREAITQFYLQLPWKPGEPVVAGPDYPVVAGAESPVIGGAESPVIGGAESPIIGGAESPVIGGAESPIIGGAESPVVGGAEYPIVGGGEYPIVGGGEYPIIGGAENPVVGGAESPILGGAEYPVVGGAESPIIGGAPTLSTDAQVVVYNQEGLFEPSGIEALQVLPTPPEVEDEPWLTPVGQAYYVQPDGVLTASRSIAFTYLQRDVPEGYEHTLAIYYLGLGETTWRRLDTKQFVENLVVADLQPEAGTYTVMSTLALPELHPGWNLIAYPLPDTRPITEALQSIDGLYAVVHEPVTDTAGLAAMVAPLLGVSGGGDAAVQAALEALLAGLETNVEAFQFGHIYLVKIEAAAPVTLYLAPPRRSPDGVIPGRQ